MKPNFNSNRRLSAGLLPLAAILALVAGMADAATDLANVPLANSNTTTIHPNIAFILDDSGSMDEENMPDDGGVNGGSYCYKWYKYNTLAYNPAVTYNPPIKADGTRFPNADFSNAILDGYFGPAQKRFDGVNTNGYTNLNWLGATTSTTATIKFDDFGATFYNVSSIKVTLLNGTTIELMKTSPEPSESGTKDADTLGKDVRDSINANTSVHGFSATYSGGSNTLTIKAPTSQFGLTTEPVLVRNKKSTGANKDVTVKAFTSNVLDNGLYYATHNTDPNSTDCDPDSAYTPVLFASGIAAPGTTPGSAAALTNYANWYSYYRKRIFMAKAGIAEAFSKLDQGKYRVGLYFINSIESGHSSSARNNDLAIDDFSGSTAGTHRAKWFDRLYVTRSSGSTPLRRALARMGQMYAGKISGWDPVQYSCQRNYAILSTDGFWNESITPKKLDLSTSVGDQDSASPAPEKDKYKASNTLADVAHYYYHTDLRPGGCVLCTDNVPGVGQEKDGDDAALHQHMTTFTVGFGVNGTLRYQSGYKTATSGDFYDIQQGTKFWPHPSDGTNDAPQRIDDLWHAAVNGHGIYLSAKDPATLSDGLTSALNAIKSVTGSGAAAATSNLQPTTGDNAIYIATYRTVHWDGELSAYSVDLSTGEITTTPIWQAATLLNAKISSSGDGDTRTIYTADGNTRTLFKVGAGGLTAAQLAYFDNSKLSQYSDWDEGQKSTATATLLVNYLRGHNRYEDQDRESGFDYKRLYRDRENVLGDIIHAQPIYVKAPPYSFTDDGYMSFKSSNAGRAGTVYAAANDGMLHAFDALTGQERWAYVPPLVLPEMWRLAGSSYGYGDNHRYILDGPLTMADAKIGGGWKTVLIGALGKGGRGYYALDVTNPDDPKPLWTFSAENNDNVGYTFGIPIVTKLKSGTWVALVTSGYNNVPEDGKYRTADGIGRLFVLNLSDGSVIKTISTGVGSTASPSGLARINVRVNDFSTNNTAEAAYGGDLLGNMWRFDLEAGTATKLASFGIDKPIMAAPEVADINGNNVVYFGTGRYLGASDLDYTAGQAIYGIKDDGSTTVSDTLKLIKQTLADSGSGERTISKVAVDWTSSSVFGWYVSLPDTGERVALDLQLFAGTLVASSVVPEASECQPGGYSWLYQLDYRTGGYVGKTTATAGRKYGSPHVGMTVSRLPGGRPVIYPINADGKITKPVEMQVQPPNAVGDARRVIWRELFD